MNAFFGNIPLDYMRVNTLNTLILSYGASMNVSIYGQFCLKLTPSDRQKEILHIKNIREPDPSIQHKTMEGT